jgi:hypothetical protein
LINDVTVTDPSVVNPFVQLKMLSGSLTTGATKSTTKLLATGLTRLKYTMSIWSPMR